MADSIFEHFFLHFCPFSPIKYILLPKIQPHPHQVLASLSSFELAVISLLQGSEDAAFLLVDTVRAAVQQLPLDAHVADWVAALIGNHKVSS
jgi:hypothetical protein